MFTIEQTIALIILLVTIIGGGLALFQYWQQSRYTRLVNLVNIWESFYKNESYTQLFSELDYLDNTKDSILELKSSLSDRYSFLAFLAHVYYLTELSHVNNEKIKGLFQWHFYYIFVNEKTRSAFWKGVFNENVSIEVELEKPYWKKYYHFAKECEIYMKKIGSI